MILLKKAKQRFKEFLFWCNWLIFKTKTQNIRFLTDEEVVDEIINGKSLARFGDGEFSWIFGIKNNSFQDNNEIMGKKLEEVLTKANDNLLIGIPKTIQNMSNYNHNARVVWRGAWWRLGKRIIPLLKKKEYANSLITRFYIDFIDKSDTINKINNLKRIWNNKDIVIVEGEQTLLGVNNDLFKNAKSIERVIVPSKNAFEKYDEILCFLKTLNSNRLFILSVGPTATILAYDLSKNGFHACDLGHIDVEYEWFKMKAKNKVKIPGKFVYEAGGIDNIVTEMPDSYLSSIIRRIE